MRLYPRFRCCFCGARSRDVELRDAAIRAAGGERARVCIDTIACMRRQMRGKIEGEAA